MDDYQNVAIFGTGRCRSAISADMLNSANASDPKDWNAILAYGIRGAAQAAISASVGEKFADGQLVSNAKMTANSDQSKNILLVCILAFFLMS